MEDLSPSSSRLQQPRWSISGMSVVASPNITHSAIGSTMVEPYTPALPKGWNSQYTSGATTPISSAPIRISGEGISLRINGNLIEVSPTSSSNDADIESREQEHDKRPSWRSVSAWRRWAKANRTWIMTLFYIVYTLVLLVPAIVTPTLVWGIIRYKVLDGQLAPGLSDALIAVL